jgi:hypothetical protein
MADNFYKFGNFYPNPNSKFIFGTSVYFPGVSFLSLLFIKIIPNRFLIEFLHAIAVFFVFALIGIQKHIIKIYFGRVSELRYYLLTALSFFIININWVTYACEFKPDTIAYCIGAFGLIIAKEDVRYTQINYIRFIIGVILTGIAICFKQQYLAFLIGLFVFALIKKSKRFWTFCILSFIFSLIVLINLAKIPFQWYWNIEVLKDDGFLDLITVIKNNSNLLPKILIYLIAVYFFSPFLSLEKIKFKYLISKSPWLTILVFILFFSFLSSIKVGGNAGNTQFGLVLLFPFSFHALRNVIKTKIVYFGIFFIFLFTLNNFNRNISHYLNYRKAFNYLEGIDKKQINDVLTGSNVYGLSRNFIDKSKIVNYNSISLIENSSQEIILDSILKKQKFDLIIIDNEPQNYSIIKRQDKYKILFLNEITLVAKIRSKYDVN